MRRSLLSRESAPQTAAGGMCATDVARPRNSSLTAPTARKESPRRGEGGGCEGGGAAGAAGGDSCGKGGVVREGVGVDEGDGEEETDGNAGLNLRKCVCNGRGFVH